MIPPKTTTGTLRRLVPADAPEYRELMLQAYAQHPDAFTSSAEERGALPLSWWQARLSAAPDAHDLVVSAWDDEMLVGAAGVGFEPRAKGRHKATLFGLYVLPAFRHAGWGARIVEAALAAARARDGVKLMQLTVTGGNAAARALYERAGFVAFGVEPFAVAVDGGYVDKVHMWCDLGLGLPATPRDRGP